MKQVWGVTMVKSEEDIIFHTLVHLAEEGLDGIIVADNLSTDNTLNEIKRAQEICTECNIIIVEDKEQGYYQSRKMTALARLAHDQGADWIIPFDADELWYSSLRLKDFFGKLPKSTNVVAADIYDHYATALDTAGDIPFETMVWKHRKLDLPKIAFKWQPDAVIGQGNHSIEMTGKRVAKGLEIRHFPYRSFEHFKRKAINGLKAYQATDLPEHMGGHWRQYGELINKWGDDVVRREVFEKYFWHFSPVDNGMVHDPAPFRRFNK